MSTEISHYLLSPQRTLATVRAHRRINPRFLDELLIAGLFADLRATRAWFAGREAGWSPAERIKRAAINAGEIWSE